jgi:hypothetical protein
MRFHSRNMIFANAHNRDKSEAAGTPRSSDPDRTSRSKEGYSRDKGTVDNQASPRSARTRRSKPETVSTCRVPSYPGRHAKSDGVGETGTTGLPHWRLSRTAL